MDEYEATGEIPPSLASRPKIPLHLGPHYGCFLRLRKVDLEHGMISFSDVCCYAEKIGVIGIDEQMNFYDIVRAFDIQRLVTTRQNQQDED
jgi:hypothetical protein